MHVQLSCKLVTEVMFGVKSHQSKVSMPLIYQIVHRQLVGLHRHSSFNVAAASSHQEYAVCC